MSVLQSIEQSDNETKVQIAFHKWNGGRFVIFQTVETYGTKKLTPFLIGNTSYLAVAYSDGENGEAPTIKLHNNNT